MGALTMIKVIGIDPGLADTGIGIVRGGGLKVHGYSYGAISTLKSEPVRVDSSVIIALAMVYR